MLLNCNNVWLGSKEIILYFSAPSMFILWHSNASKLQRMGWSNNFVDFSKHGLRTPNEGINQISIFSIQALFVKLRNPYIFIIMSTYTTYGREWRPDGLTAITTAKRVKSWSLTEFWTPVMYACLPIFYLILRQSW